MGHLDIVRNNMHLCFLLEEGEEAKLLAVEPATGGASDYTAAPLASRIVEVQIPERKNKSFRGAKNLRISRLPGGSDIVLLWKCGCLPERKKESCG